MFGTAVLCSRDSNRSGAVDVERCLGAVFDVGHREEERLSVDLSSVGTNKLLTFFRDEPVGEVSCVFNIGLRELLRGDGHNSVAV